MADGEWMQWYFGQGIEALKFRESMNQEVEERALYSLSNKTQVSRQVYLSFRCVGTRM
jgi:hypothetical protein